MNYCDLSFNLPIDEFFTYKVPADFKDLIFVGQRVEAVFRGRKKIALVTRLHDVKPEFKTLEIERVLDETNLTPSYIFEIAGWISKYYGASLNEAVHLFVNSAKKPVKNKVQAFKAHPFYPLNEEQKIVYEKIKPFLNSFFPALIFGITGSGKTEVYRHLVRDVVNSGKQALILVPEIALTPQTIQRFASLFGEDKISVINSRMTPSNRLFSAFQIKSGESSIILGPRSALFSPFKNLGIIIIDEEQEGSYKSAQTPRYHAKQVAFKIAQKLKIPLILGSATPAMETYHAAKQGKIHFFKLTKRHAGIKLPSVKAVDLKNEKGFFSKELVQKILTYHKHNFQSILFLNRRGFSPTVLCEDCSHQFKCPHCSVKLTYHKKTNHLMCHYCGYQEPLPSACPSCGSLKLQYSGMGTEKLEQELSELFHRLKILRMDKDSTAKKGSHEEILNQFREGKADLLLGTQMIAKGLDFDLVRLVGVINADITLNLPDFRSGEYAFSLLTQVAGRSGRKMSGEVIIQSYTPEHYVIKKAVEQDYEGFFEKEIQQRKNFFYPPFSRIIRIVIRGEQEEQVVAASGKLSEILGGKSLKFYGPVACPLEKINKNYRYHLFFKVSSVLPVLEKVKDALNQLKKLKTVYFELDVDPVSML